MSERNLSYQQAIDWIFGLINFERRAGRARDFRLDRMRRLLATIENPHEQIPAIHVAGTKGKGSTAAMIAAMLAHSGHVTGLFTSPHITRFEERIQVDAVEPSAAELAHLVAELQSAIERSDGPNPTYFEAALLLAWCYYRDKQTDFAVLEVGLGGRLDATNVCVPRVCVITSISLDHTAVLGNTVEQIATEKAGIIKPGIPVVSGVTDAPAQAVIRSVAAERGCDLFELNCELSCRYTPPGPGQRLGRVKVQTPWTEWPDVEVPLPGQHQGQNAALAIAALDVLRQTSDLDIDTQTLAGGLRGAANLPARIEVVAAEPMQIVDAAHNEASIAAVVATLNEMAIPQPRVAIFAATAQKDVAGMLVHLINAFDDIVLTEYVRNPRAVPRQDLVELTERTGGTARIHVAETPSDALARARALCGAAGSVVTTGSFFIAAEVRELIVGE